MKTCTKCKIEKSLDDFYFKSNRNFERVSRCKPCTTEDRREYNKAYYAATREKSENARNLRMYGITLQERDEILARQNGICPICRKADGPWAVDHDHACCPSTKTCGNCIRGILCAKCNKALGLFKDDIETLKAAIEYLKD